MTAAIKHAEKSSTNQEPSVPTRARISRFAQLKTANVYGLTSIQQSAGNMAIQRAMPVSPFLPPLLDMGSGPTSFVVPKQVTGSEKASAPQSKAESEQGGPVEEGTLTEGDAEAPLGKEIPGPPATAEKAPASPEEDSAFHAVVGEMEIKAKQQRTPLKTPAQKQEETRLAANLTPDKVRKETDHTNHLNALEKVANVDLTIEQFMGQFEATIIKNLAETIPDKKDKSNAPSAPQDYKAWKKVGDQTAEKLAAGKDTEKQVFAAQNASHAKPLRTALDNPPTSSDNKKAESKLYELKVDPAGSAPKIKQAQSAAPKAKNDAAISLDDQSRALDEALLNHNAGGQTININEGSLAFPVSGEKSFDEAGEAKRKAQDELARARPRYREEEKVLLRQSQNDFQSLVNTIGLQGHHGVRSQSFKTVLGVQELHKSSITNKKESASSELERIYEEKKTLVNKELGRLNTVTIDTPFEDILSNAEKHFAEYVRNDLEYIYTPGHLGLDYSDWIDEHERDVEKEFQEQKRSRGSSGNTHGLGVDPAYFAALKVVQDRSAKELFTNARATFIDTVKKEVEDRIAKLVVEVLNTAKKHIRDGKAEVEEAYRNLPDHEKAQARMAFEAVSGKFEDLEESVEGRQGEILNDMARTYNQSVGKLQGKFDEIKKDVLTSWLEKAWNKLKAIVNAIIEFATRIAELLSRIAYLVGDIISSPRYFFNNLVTGIGRGFSTFVDQIDDFLATAFFDWLRGSSGIRIQIPKDWGPKGIFSLFTQLLNLSTETIWERMEIVYDKTIANAFRRGEILFEKGLEIFGIIKNEGLGGLWGHIKESLGNILEETLGMIKETVLYAAIKKVIVEIGKMLVPGGGFIAIAQKVIRLVQFIVEARNKILDLIESFVDSMEKAVKGDIPGIVKLITGALTKFITVALDFLVTFFGLGSLKEKVERFIQRMRNPIIRGIDWVLGKVKPLVLKGKDFLEKGKEKLIGAGEKVAGAVAGWLGIRKRFKVREGEQHTLYFNVSRQLVMASNGAVVFANFVNSLIIPVHKQSRLNPLLAAIVGQLRHLDAVIANTAMPEVQKQNQIQAILELIGPEIAELMRETSGGLLRSEAPRYGGLHGGFGSGMRVRIVDGIAVTRGSQPSVTGGHWDNLRKRKTSIGAADTFFIRAHLLNDNLGGPGNNWQNLSVLSQHANNRDWYGSGSHETAVESRLKGPLSESGKGFIYVVTANYSRRRNTALISAINDLINHKNNVAAIPAPSLPSDISYINSYSVAQLSNLRDVVSSEEFVPTSFVCTIREIDPSTGDEVSTSDHNINRTIENDIQGNYFV